MVDGCFVDHDGTVLVCLSVYDWTQEENEGMKSGVFACSVCSVAFRSFVQNNQRVSHSPISKSVETKCCSC